MDGFVFQIGKTDIAYLLRQGHLGGKEGEVASLSMCSGDPDGGHAVKGSVVYVPCPNGVTAVKVSAKPPYLKQLWTDNDGAAGAPIIADGLVWTIGGNAVHGLNPTNGDEVVSIPFGGYANHFPTPSVGDGLLLLPGTDQVFAFMGPAGLPTAASRSLVTVGRPAQPASTPVAHDEAGRAATLGVEGFHGKSGDPRSRWLLVMLPAGLMVCRSPTQPPPQKPTTSSSVGV